MGEDGLYFRDRKDAGEQLARALLRFKDEHPIILALPRGGVPIAFEVAKVLDATLEVALVRKLGAPGYPELGLGAVVDGQNPQVVLNDDVVRITQPDQSYIDAETHRQLAELERRRKLYRGNQPAPSLAGRTVILVDDGIATGGTVRAVLRALRGTKPAHLILAVPVAPPESIAALSAEADEIVVLSQPDPFYAVGAHYRDFNQTSDEEVIQLLRDARPFGQAEMGRAAS